MRLPPARPRCAISCATRADVAGAHQQHEVAVAAPAARARRAAPSRDFDQHRVDAAARTHRARERLAVGVRDRRLAGGIDLGQHQHVDAATAPPRTRRAGRACACSGAAGTRPRGAAPASRRAPPRTPPRARADGGRSRRRTARCRRPRARARRGRGSGGRRRLKPASARCDRVARRRRAASRPRPRRARSARCAGPAGSARHGAASTPGRCR